MSKKITLNVFLFGCLRKYSDNNPLILTINAGAMVHEIKKALLDLLVATKPDFNDHDIISVSALAYNQQILSDNTPVVASGDLAVLPPVCGG